MGRQGGERRPADFRFSSPRHQLGTRFSRQAPCPPVLTRQQSLRISHARPTRPLAFVLLVLACGVAGAIQGSLYRTIRRPIHVDGIYQVFQY